MKLLLIRLVRLNAIVKRFGLLVVDWFGKLKFGPNGTEYNMHGTRNDRDGMVWLVLRYSASLRCLLSDSRHVSCGPPTSASPSPRPFIIQALYIQNIPLVGF